ncbi:MAG TPA: murein biosynthesis integral membrane protein MurJ [Acidimicrobiales bacterium]
MPDDRDSRANGTGPPGRRRPPPRGSAPEYGAGNRERARRFYEPDAPTGELVVHHQDVFGLAAESPGVAGQPLAPWMTGEHQAIVIDEAVMPAEVMPPVARPVPPPAGPAPPIVPPGDGGEAEHRPPQEPPPYNAKGSFLVAAGIFLSRCAGLIREMVIGAFLGVGGPADAFKAALRIPNLMQNLLGEGVLSASFIPVYARLRAEGRHEEAGRVAGAIAGLLIAVTGAISVIGIVFAAPLTRILVPGFTAETYDLAVQLTRIMFPGIGFLVLSAWCLGVLNSHRQFFLSYVAPVLWNVAQIIALLAAVLVVGGYKTLDQKESLAIALAWGVLAGGILQFSVQIGPVRRLLGEIHLSLDTADAWVRSVLSRFVPVLLGRGAIQIMGWVDLLLASLLVTGAVSSLTYAMVLYLLPVSLFGVSVAAAELPDLSQVEVHDPDTRRRFRLRLEDSMARIAWYVAPTATLFIVVGDVIVAAVFERGSFNSADTIAVWLTLAFLSMGLLPITAARLLQNGLYALDDARTPARLGVIGVVLAAAIGLVFMFPFDRLFVGAHGIEGWGDFFTWGPLPDDVRRNLPDVPHLGIVGLALGATISDWIEYRLLSTSLAWRVGRTHMAGRWLNQIALGCAATAAVAFACELAFGNLPNLIAAVFVCGPAAATYVAVTWWQQVPESVATVKRLQGLLARARR